MEFYLRKLPKLCRFCNKVSHDRGFKYVHLKAKRFILFVQTENIQGNMKSVPILSCFTLPWFKANLSSCFMLTSLVLETGYDCTSNRGASLSNMYIKWCMDSSSELFIRSQYGYFGVCWIIIIIKNTNITLEWAHKQFDTRVYTFFISYMV